MKKFLLTIFVFWIGLAICDAAQSRDLRSASPSLVISGYDDYLPLGYLGSNDEFKTVYQPILEKMMSEISVEIKNRGTEYSLFSIIDEEDISTKIRRGDIDLFIGAYNQTLRFENLNLMFPAILHNPVSFFMLPARTAELKNTDDLQKLKGIRYAKEMFSDFVEEKIAMMGVEKSESTYEMFEKLFNRKVDYIIAGYYFGMSEAIKLGIDQQIAASKQALWNIPIFVGVAKLSPYRDALARNVGRYFQDEKIVGDIKDNMRNILEDLKKEYAGVVPPTFGLEKQDDNDGKGVENIDKEENPVDETAVKETESVATDNN